MQMYPEQQRLIQGFVASLVLNPSILRSIRFDPDVAFGGEKIY